MSSEFIVDLSGLTDVAFSFCFVKVLPFVRIFLVSMEKLFRCDLQGFAQLFRHKVYWRFIYVTNSHQPIEIGSRFLSLLI